MSSLSPENDWYKNIYQLALSGKIIVGDVIPVEGWKDATTREFHREGLQEGWQTIALQILRQVESPLHVLLLLEAFEDAAGVTIKDKDTVANLLNTQIVEAMSAAVAARK